MDVEGEKSDEDATYVEDQGNEADRDTNANLEGRDDVKADVVLPQVQATQEIEDTHVTLTPVNPDGQQQSSSVSSGFVSNMLKPKIKIPGLLMLIFGHKLSYLSNRYSYDEDSDNEVEGVDVEGEKSNEDATYVEDQGNEADRDTNANLEGRDDVKADVVLPQSSSVSSGFVSNMLNPNQDTGVDDIFGYNAEATFLVNIPVTAIAEPSFFAPTNPLEDNFLEFKQTNQYAKTLSSIPSIVDQYLANKMKEAVDVAVQLKSGRIREEAQAENQQFLDSIDEGMKKVIKEQEAKTSHAVAANLSELELKKILIDKMEANKSISTRH
ncbi:hypothetical protein Tco_0078036 [Tanacetum coccineum]